MAARRKSRQQATAGLSPAQVTVAHAVEGLERERVVEVQRARLLKAMTYVAVERGAGSVTVGMVVERAGVSRRTFYEQFDGASDCLLEAVDQALASTCRRVGVAVDPGASWRQRMRDGLVALLGFFDEERAIARLLVVESLAAGPEALERRTRALGPLIAAVDAGREHARSPSSVPPLAGESVVGGMLAVIHSRICSRPSASLSELASELMGMLVLPYLGSGAARRELARPVPVPPVERVDAPMLSDPFKDAGMRLTYRTIRVLGAIESHPGSSNRQLGDTAGIDDQGQTSKLLGRLERLGLIENISTGHSKGDANAWTLTPTGREITQGIRAHTGNSQVPAGRNQTQTGDSRNVSSTGGLAL